MPVVQRRAECQRTQGAERELAQADSAGARGHLLGDGQRRGIGIAARRNDEIARGQVDVDLLETAGQLGGCNGGVGAAGESAGQRRIVASRTGEGDAGLAAVGNHHAVAGHERLGTFDGNANAVSHDRHARRRIGQGADASRRRDGRRTRRHRCGGDRHGRCTCVGLRKNDRRNSTCGRKIRS